MTANEAYMEKALEAYLPDELLDYHRSILAERNNLRETNNTDELEQIRRRMSDLERANQHLHIGYPTVAKNFWVLKSRFEKVCKQIEHLLDAGFVSELQKSVYKK